jgi:hypothetical protein
MNPFFRAARRSGASEGTEGPEDLKGPEGCGSVGFIR